MVVERCQPLLEAGMLRSLNMRSCAQVHVAGGDGDGVPPAR